MSFSGHWELRLISNVYQVYLLFYIGVEGHEKLRSQNFRLFLTNIGSKRLIWWYCLKNRDDQAEKSKLYFMLKTHNYVLKNQNSVLKTQNPVVRTSNPVLRTQNSLLRTRNLILRSQNFILRTQNSITLNAPSGQQGVKLTTNPKSNLLNILNMMRCH